MELTKTQISYIVAIYQLMGGDTSQGRIADYLGIRKPTANVALKILEEKGYVEKITEKDRVTYTLKEKSEVLIEKLNREKHEFMSLFRDYLGMDRNIAEETYKNIYSQLGDNFVNCLEKLRENNYKHCENKIQSENGIPYGTYKIPFKVAKDSDNSARSMGDKGFKHPAKIVVNGKKSYIVLEDKKVNYKAESGQTLRGRLMKFYYFADEKWNTVENLDEHQWIIPLESIETEHDTSGNATVGTVKIKAAATSMKMPESVAEMTFNFKLLSPADEK